MLSIQAIVVSDGGRLGGSGNLNWDHSCNDCLALVVMGQSYM